MTDPSDTADPVAVALPRAAQHLEEIARQLGSAAALRERHMNHAVNEALAAVCRCKATTSKLALSDWPSLGRSTTDTVVWSSPKRPLYGAELKWCHSGEDKVHEAIWDLFKMALTLRLDGVARTYLITGAPVSMWSTALCRDLFDGGTFTPVELCSRRFPGGKNRLLWDWLLEGGYDHFPLRVPGRIETRRLPRVKLFADKWEFRTVSISLDGRDPDTPFPRGWPHGARPRDATRPLASE